MKRLGFALLIISSLWIALRLLQAYQRARASDGLGVPSATSGQVSLLMVVSAHCSVCPAQKKVVAKLAEKYPQLHVETLNVEDEPEHARALRVMTVPTTLISSPEGVVAHINNGFTAQAKLETQIGELIGRAG